MRQSQLFAKSKKTLPRRIESISHQLLLKGDFIEQTAAGVYSFLPLGFRVLKRIENIIREEMKALGAQEILMPSLIPKSLWEKTGRWRDIDPPLFKVKDRHGKDFGLGPTHEEVITELAKDRIKSYKDLPQALFQIQEKFRNELRPTGGLLRTREFLMKDLYSFHQSGAKARAFYEKVKEAYFRIYKRCELEALCVEAETGTIGGSLSHEFMVLSESGEDKIVRCSNCGFAANIEKAGRKKKCPVCRSSLEEQNCIEAGHIFYLGEKYSKAMGALFSNAQGERRPVIMGCYGIGLGRLLATIVEVHHDEKGIIWPKETAPFDFHLITIEEDAKVREIAEKIYRLLLEKDLTVLYDDRKEKSAGEKFADADLIGIPWRLVVSKKTLEQNAIEIKKRDKRRAKLLKLGALPKWCQEKIEDYGSKKKRKK